MGLRSVCPFSCALRGSQHGECTVLRVGADAWALIRLKKRLGGALVLRSRVVSRALARAQFCPLWGRVGLQGVDSWGLVAAPPLGVVALSLILGSVVIPTLFYLLALALAICSFSRVLRGSQQGECTVLRVGADAPER